MANDPAHETSPAFKAKLDAFNNKMSERVDAKQFPGMQYILSSRGEVVTNQCLGVQDLATQAPVTDQSLFRLASASKIFISIAFLRLVQKGLIALESPVAGVFPEYGSLKVLTPKGETTAAKQPMQMIDLLRHSCGYGYGDGDYKQGQYRQALLSADLLGVNDTPHSTSEDHWIHNNTLRDWASALARVPLEDEPGTRVSYGLGHDIAGAVIEEFSGEPLDQFMAREVFEPLGLSNTFFVVPKSRSHDLTSYYTISGKRGEQKLELVEDAQTSPFKSRPKSFSGGGGWDMLGNGGLTTNAQDFVALLQMIVNMGVHEGQPFLTPAHAQQLCASQSHNLEHPMMLPGCEYSYGTAEVIDPKVYHEQGTSSSGPKGKLWWGGSTNTYFFYVPAKRKVGVFLTNTFPFGHKGAIYQFGSLSE